MGWEGLEREVVGGVDGAGSENEKGFTVAVAVAVAVCNGWRWRWGSGERGKGIYEGKVKKTVDGGRGVKY